MSDYDYESEQSMSEDPYDQYDEPMKGAYNQHSKKVKE